MHYGNNRAPSSAPNERQALMSAMAVKCCDYLPALTDCGRFVIGDSKLRLDSVDHLPPALLIIEVLSIKLSQRAISISSLIYKA